MKSFKCLCLGICLMILACGDVFAQCGGTYSDSNGNAIPCGANPGFPCCQVPNACNGPNYENCNNYDPDYSETNGCDLSCAPIDSGVLVLLLGGGLFGGVMIMRRRESDMTPLVSKG